MAPASASSTVDTGHLFLITESSGRRAFPGAQGKQWIGMFLS
jgi:hypothetical protein